MLLFDKKTSCLALASVCLLAFSSLGSAADDDDALFAGKRRFLLCTSVPTTKHESFLPLYLLVCPLFALCANKYPPPPPLSLRLQQQQ